MKRNFTQPFEYSETTVDLLVRVDDGNYLLFEDTDDPTLTYYRLPSLKLDRTDDVALRLTERLYELGLALNGFRLLAQDNPISYSLMDDTPGEVASNVCYLVYADRTVREIATTLGKPLFLPLDDFLARLKDSPIRPRIVELGVANLLSQQTLLRFYGCQPAEKDPFIELMQILKKWNASFLAFDNGTKTEKEVIGECLSPFGSMSNQLSDIIQDADMYKAAQQVLDLAADLDWSERLRQEEHERKLEQLRKYIQIMNRLQ